MNLFLIFQIEKAGDRLVDYGILGIVLIGVSFIAYRMYQAISENMKEWRTIAKEQLKNNYDTHIEQNRINQSLITIRERDVEQNRDFNKFMEAKISELPKHIRSELRSELLQQSANKISSSGQ
jgi:hypothetical protein